MFSVSGKRKCFRRQEMGSHARQVSLILTTWSGRKAVLLTEKN